MSDEGAPTPVKPENTGSVSVVERKFHVWLWGALSLGTAVLLTGDITLYSLYQTELSRVDTLEHRVDRLNNMMTNMLKSSDQSEKIEKIGQKVTQIDGQMKEITDAIMAQDAKEDPAG